MHYHLLLVLDENTFRSSALTYTLKSNNIDDNGYIVPEIITQTGIKTDKREIFLGNGMFTPTNNEDKVHSYTLKLYFPKIENFEHGIDQGKIFKAHIETRDGWFHRGGHINAELRCGIFYYQDSSGSPRHINTFRPILTPLIP